MLAVPVIECHWTVGIFIQKWGRILEAGCTPAAHECNHIYIYIYTPIFCISIPRICKNTPGSTGYQDIWSPSVGGSTHQLLKKPTTQLWLPSRERSHIPPNGKRNIIFKSALLGDMLVPRRVVASTNFFQVEKLRSHQTYYGRIQPET